MKAGKRRISGLVMAVVLSVFFLVSQRPVFAVAGQINNLLNAPTPPPTETVVTAPDTAALDACNERKSQIQEELNNCQQATALNDKIDSKNDVQEHLYLYWAIGSTILAIILGITLAAVSLKKKETPPAAPVVPPFAA